MKKVYLADVLTVLNQELQENYDRELEAVQNGLSKIQRTVSDVFWARELVLQTVRRKILKVTTEKE